MHYLYRIINQLNNKVYIGQTNNPDYRWYQHRSYAGNKNKHKQYIHYTMAKYGSENFLFEVIAICLTQEDTNDTESVLIKQYNSRDKNFGYNLMIGGSYGGHSEDTKEKLRQATINQIKTKGHPAKNRIVTQEEKELHRKARLEKPLEYTEELRHKMSESHIGHIDSDDTKNKKSESAKVAWSKRLSYDDIKCEAPGCDVCGKHKYMIVQGIRYCSKHGFRMLRYGRLNTIR